MKKEIVLSASLPSLVSLFLFPPQKPCDDIQSYYLVVNNQAASLWIGALREAELCFGALIAGGNLSMQEKQKEDLRKADG